MKKIVIILFLFFAASITNVSAQNPDIDQLITRAKAGDPIAQNELAIFYEQGKGLTQNYATAMQWYQKAAMQNHPDATANIGRLYLLGLGVERNEAEGIKWIQKSADMGFPAAQNHIGHEYIKGSFYKQDYQKAFEYFNKSASQNYPGSQINLAKMYTEGLYVDKNFAKAGELYAQGMSGNITQEQRQEIQQFIDFHAKSCSKNKQADGIKYDLDSCFLGLATKNPAVLHAVGLAYLSGQAVDQDKARAFQYLNQSAKLGFPAAQIHLAIMYDEGDGIAQNLVETYAWFSAAETYPDLLNIQQDVIAVGKKSALKNLNFIEGWKAKSKAKEYIKFFGYNHS